MFKCKCKCSRDFPEEPLRNAFGKKGDPLLDWAVGKPDAQRPGIAVGFQGGQTTPSISARNSGRKEFPEGAARVSNVAFGTH